jgi:phytoene dehydrogenase-like protein
MTTRYDALIIGGGHNGLVCAFYLARAGLKVRILERRDVIGGACVTEEFSPGFRNSTASYTVSLLRPKVIRDMRLHERGWRIIERTISNFFPLENDYLKLGGGTARTQAEFARFSKRDAAAFPAYEEALERVAEVLRGISLKTPPNAGGGVRALLAAASQGRSVAGLDIEAQRDVLDLFVKSARDFLDGWYESDAVKAAFGFDAVVGNYASPDTPGSAYVLLHHVFGEINGKKGMWGHSVGGMGAITRFMAEACVEAGVEISLEEPVAQVLVDGGRVAGVRLDSGEEIAAGTVVSRSAARVQKADRPVENRIGHVPHECCAVRTARLQCVAGQGARRAPHLRDHHCAEPRLYGPRLFRRAGVRVVEGAYCRNETADDGG